MEDLLEAINNLRLAYDAVDEAIRTLGEDPDKDLDLDGVDEALDSIELGIADLEAQVGISDDDEDVPNIHPFRDEVPMSFDEEKKEAAWSL